MNKKHHITATRVAAVLFVTVTLLLSIGQNLSRLQFPPWETCWTHSFTMMTVCLSFLDVVITTLSTPLTLIPTLIITALVTEAYVKREAIRTHFLDTDDD